MKGSGENRGNPQLIRFRASCKKIGSLYPDLSHVLKTKGYLKSCHGNCVSKFSPSDVTNIRFEEERGNPH